MFSKEVLIDSLTVIKEKALSGEITCLTMGICGNWSEESGLDEFSYILVETFSPSWDKFSGDPSIPVVGDYFSSKLWEGEQLELRLSLIDHILKRLEEVDQEWLDKLYEEVYSE